VVDAHGRLCGVLEKEVAVRTEILRPTIDPAGRLMVAAALGISGQTARTAARLVELGVGCVVIDTAHGHQRRMLEAVHEVRQVIGRRVPLVAGNVCTAEGTRALVEAGADVVKVNVGPGAMCTTRMQTGVGRPSFSSVLAAARQAHALGRHVWADGGVRYPRDVALYLAAGASRVMVGTMLAGTYESPGDIKEDREGRLYKENYGMASARAVQDRSEGDDAFTRAKKGFFREGISTSRIYLREGFESVGDIVLDAISGILSTFTYVGAATLAAFRQQVVVGVQTSGGWDEGTPHGKVRG
jgi:IMP dehydrogenase